MAAELGHAASRVYRDQSGNFHLNGAAFYNDAEEDISPALESLDQVSIAELEFLDGALAGAVVASKTVVYDANGRVVRNVAAPAAAGTNQGNATALTKDLNAVTGATGATGVRLPVPVAGAEVLVINTDATSALLVYPATDGVINALGANNAFTLAAGKAAVLIATAAGQWYTAGVGVAMSGDATLSGAGALTIANDAVSNAKLANITRGSIKVGGAADAPTDLDAKTSGQILVGDGTDVVSVPVSGDATLSAAGAVTIAAAPATGKIAQGLVDFNATGDCNAVVVGAVTYTHNEAPVVTNGEWAYGASAAASATNLAAGINGDTRNAGGAYYIAVASDTTVFIFALTAGTAGNVTVSRTAGVNPDVVENLVGGVATGAKKLTVIKHTVTTEEGTQVEAHVPLPFVPTTFTAQVRDSNGAIKAVTDLFTIQTTPNRIRVATGGATHIAATDTITIVAME